MGRFPSKALTRAKLNARDAIREDARLGSTARTVGEHYIATHVNKHCLEAWPSYETVATRLSRSSRTVRRAIGELERAGHFERVASRGKTVRFCFPVIDQELNVDRPWTEAGQTCRQMRASLSTRPGQNCPTTPLTDSRKTLEPDLRGRSFPRYVVVVGSSEAGEWEEALKAKDLYELETYEIREVEDDKEVYILPAPRPPADDDDAEWRRIRTYLSMRRR